MTPSHFSHSGLAAFRSCPRKYALRYKAGLEEDTDDESEALSVGKSWHAAFDCEIPYDEIVRTAPSTLWATKLSRLYSMHQWYWKDADADMTVVAVEKPFKIPVPGIDDAFLVGFIDEIVRTADGRLGIIERKTTASDISPTSSYWDAMLISPQPAIYAHVIRDEYGALPDFVIYDVVKKPGIKPKAVTKKQREEWMRPGPGSYYGEPISSDEALLERESDRMYGARLQAAIAENPAAYFARKQVPLTIADADDVLANIGEQIDSTRMTLPYRNTDACTNFGRRCEFMGLCNANTFPGPDDAIPNGFRRRERVMPESVKSAPIDG